MRVEHRLTPELKRRALELASEVGPDRQRIATALGVPYHTLDNWVHRQMHEEWIAAVESYHLRREAERELAPMFRRDVAREQAQQTVRDSLNLPVPVFAVPIPAPATVKEGKVTRAVVLGDTHIPYQDDGALAVIEGIIQDAKPDYLVHLGDLLDAGMLSDKFAQDPTRLESLQADIDAARTKLHQWAQLAPHAQRILLEGNHEERLTRCIWGLKDAARELARLRLFQAHMSWPHFLGLEQIGWRWVGYRDQPARDVLPKLLVKHGDRVSQWAGFTAKREWMAYGRSGISGHCHRATVWPHADDNGVARWIEAGCTCRYDVPWATHTDWQQAVTVIEWSADRRLMNVEQALIRNGSTLWRGKEYAL